MEKRKLKGVAAKPGLAFLINPELAGELFSPALERKLEESFEVRRGFEAAPGEALKALAGSRACLTSWGTPGLSVEAIGAAPGLRVIVHAAGSVKNIVSEAVWERGIKVSSCAAAIGIGVAEHALGLMLSAMKRCCRFNEIVHAGGWQDRGEMSRIREICGMSVGVLGAGLAGRHFIKLMGLFPDLKEVLVYDPYLSAGDIRDMGAEKIKSLDLLMSRVDVLSVHVPAVQGTRHMLNRENLRLLKEGAILINTSRGAVIDETALYEEAESGRITACLDVTDPEPPAADNPLRKLGNIIFTPHIAGAAKNNKLRIGNLAFSELERFFSGKPLRYEVKKCDLGKIA